MKAVVNESICEGYGKCVRIAPDIFKMDAAGIAQVLVEGDLKPEQMERAKAAAVLCPTKAIALVETEPKGQPSE